MNILPIVSRPLLAFILALSLLTAAAMPAAARTDPKRQRALNAAEAAKSGVPDEAFVQDLYRTLLGREADPEGLAGYVRELTLGQLSRGGIRLDIMKSVEFRDRQRAKLITGTTPATPGAPPPPVVGGDPAKPGVPAPPKAAPDDPKAENAAFVRWLYRAVLRRAPDDGGLAAHTARLNAGELTRDELQAVFLASDEYKTRTASGEIPPFDPAKAGDFRGTLDDLFAGWTAQGGPSDETGARQPQEFPLPGAERGAVQFDTKGITHQEHDGPKGGDFWFLVMEGAFGQLRLQHTAGTTDGGTPRAIRYYIKPKTGDGRLGIEVASDNLPDWHTWRVEWEPGRVAFFLDGNMIGEETGISIKPTRVMVGGYVGGSRNFKGAWRNYRAR